MSARPIADTAPNLAPPPGNPRFPLFDSLRAIAALLVFFGHTLAITNASRNYELARYDTHFAAEGVALFFLISGFLLYRPFLVARLADRPYRLADYARRRVLRIVPAYWVALTILVVYVSTNGVRAGNFWQFYGFGQIYEQDTVGQGIGAAWTLCVEVIFYALLPGFAWAAARLGRGVRGGLLLLAATGVASIVIHGLVYESDEPWRAIWLPMSFYWFAAGMLLAVASTARPRAAAVIGRFPDLCWAAAVGLFAVVCVALADTNRAGTGGPIAFVLYGLIAALLLAPAVFADDGPGLSRRVLRARVLSWIGLVSYGFYLYHANVIVYVQARLAQQDVPHPYLATLALALPAVCIAAAASFYLLERPILRLKEVPLDRWRKPGWLGRRRAVKSGQGR